MSVTLANKYLGMTLADFENSATITALDNDYTAGKLTAAEYTNILKYRQKLFSDEWDRRIAAGQTPQVILNSEDGHLLLGYRHGFEDAKQAIIDNFKQHPITVGSNWLVYGGLGMLFLLIFLRR